MDNDMSFKTNYLIYQILFYFFVKFVNEGGEEKFSFYDSEGKAFDIYEKVLRDEEMFYLIREMEDDGLLKDPISWDSVKKSFVSHITITGKGMRYLFEEEYQMEKFPIFFPLLEDFNKRIDYSIDNENNKIEFKFLGPEKGITYM